MRQRPRRLRRSPAIRDMVREYRLTPSHLISPVFLLPPDQSAQPIDSLPGISRINEEDLLKKVEEGLGLGLKSFVLFPVVPEARKDQKARYSWQADNFYLQAIEKVKSAFPEVCIITDVAMDPYSSDGHDGLVEGGIILNDESLEILANMALAQARAGADIVGPSDMMDGRVGFIRDRLDEAGFTQVGIMAYTAKYASGFYGPFRDALDSAPKFGDKKTYQMDPANAEEALREAKLDEAEGADFLMVKPALAYLDIIRRLKDHSHLPIVAYQVSGEYAMIQAAAERGWLDGEQMMLETLLSIRRAGADLIISYFAPAYASWFSSRNLPD